MAGVAEIREELLRLGDTGYREFQSKLIPTVDPDHFIGVRTPELRKMAKNLSRQEDAEEFLNDLPHRFFDENQLHAFIISEIKDFDRCLAAVNRFLPYVDNWATCDQMSPKVFKRHKKELPGPVNSWISGGETYTVRFGVKMLMEHFLDDAFDPAYLDLAAKIRSEEYYIRMMIAWYFATALAKQYDAAIPFITDRRLDIWTHNKTIQKAIESYRISPEQKEYLRSQKEKEKRRGGNEDVKKL